MHVIKFSKKGEERRKKHFCQYLIKTGLIEDVDVTKNLILT
jgi:hypothetical protein